MGGGYWLLPRAIFFKNFSLFFYRDLGTINCGYLDPQGKLGIGLLFPKGIKKRKPEGVGLFPGSRFWLPPIKGWPD